MKTILYFQPRRYGVWQSMLLGLQKAAGKEGWIVHTMPLPETDDSYGKILQTWDPSGCIVDCTAGECPPGDDVFGDRAVVFLNRPPDSGQTRYRIFMHDSVAVAEMAADELLSTGFEHYAYVPFAEKMMWSEIREKVFSKRIKYAGKKLVRFRRGDFSSWLKTLPKPCGIFAANDTVAYEVTAIAQMSGLRVPDDVAVVGVDNEEFFCEGIMPGITSVETNLEEAGFRMGELLVDEIVHGVRPEAGTVYYQPSRMVRRGSTRLFNVHEPRVAEAVDFIRRHACTMKIRIEDVMEIMKCSRCEATMRFRNATGRSILEEIHEVRFRRMCELLENTTMKISAVIAFCGYSSETFPKRFFLRRTGMTMKKYRAAASGASPR